MAHTTGSSFASHARSASVANSPSAHRRAGAGIGSTQHASPSSNSIFPRSFANAAFPGTVSAPRSAAAPNSASVPSRSIQYLSLLTTKTPTSIAKLAFPPHTTVFWYRLQKRSDDATTTIGHDHLRQDAASSAAASSTDSSPEPNNAWSANVQRVLSSVNKSQLRQRALDESQGRDHTPFRRLLKDPLIHTSSKGSPSSNDASSSSRKSKANLWVFIVVADTDELVDKAASDNAREVTDNSSANTSKGDATADKDVELTTHGDSASLDPTIARHLSADLAKSLARLSPSARVSSGSYRLSAAATLSIDGKGKQSSLTWQQRQAHKRFMASTQARIIDFLAGAQPPSTKQSRSDTTSKRDRLRIGDGVVFLPSRSTVLHSTPASDSAWFAAPPGPSTASSSDVAHSRCLLTRPVVSLTSTSLFVHVTSSPIAALPLTCTRFANVASPPPSPQSRPRMLITPLGCRAELIGVVPTSDVAHEHIAELSSAFATFDAVNDQSPFASGVAICAFSATPSEPQSHQRQPHLHNSQQIADVTSAPEETLDLDFSLPTTTASADEPAIANATGEGSLHFLWPAAWCLVIEDHPNTSGGAMGLGTSASSDLRSMQDQPLTPLKELVSFTLKVLNDANESALAQSTAPYTPGEPDDDSLGRRRADRLPSTRPDITPASMSFADFDFAMPTAGSATPSHAVPAAVPSVPPGASPLKRESSSIEPVQAANSTESFGQDLNWMQFLPPQSSDAPASSSEAAFAMQIDATSADPTVNANPLGLDEAQHRHTDQTGSHWILPNRGSSASQIGAGAAGTRPSNPTTSQSLLQPQPHLQSHGSTPFQGQQETTPLEFAQSISSKRKAGEGDIFGNLDLLTEDDFSFFDESAFGLDPEGDLSHNMNEPVEAVQTGPSQHHLAYDQPQALANHSTAPILSMPNEAHPAPSMAAAVIDDVAMEDVGQSSLDALFSAIPGLQDAMASTQSSQAQTAPLQPPVATSTTSMAQPSHSRSGPSAVQDMALSTAGSVHTFHPALSSFTPRDASGATPFGDPASLPGFTPSSLTESSPAFGNPHYKTPRTPYSPVEEYRDGATIVELHNSHRMGESSQSYRERNAASAPDLHGSDQHPHSGHKANALLHDDQQLRLADASTAAAAAANAAMETDASSRKRPAIVPNAFRPLKQPEARKPLQRLPAGARASLGRKYDLLGKFASRPKTATATASTTALNASIASATTEPPVSSDAGKVGERMDKQSASDSGRPGSHPPVTWPSPSKTPSHRGQALLQLRRDRHGRSSPGSGLINLGRSSSSRLVEGPATPRSSDDALLSGVMGNSDSDTSASGDDDSDDALSDSEAATLTLSPHVQATLKDVSLDVVTSFLCGASRVSWSHSPILSSTATHQIHESAASLEPLVMLHLPLSRSIQTALVMGTAAATSSSSPRRPTLRRWMLSRTAAWLIQNPQFRYMYGMQGVSCFVGSEIPIDDKIEVLEAMAAALGIEPASTLPDQSSETSTAAGSPEVEATLPTLRNLVRPSKNVAGVAGDGVEVAEVLEPTRIAVGCQGSVVEALPSSLTLWDKSKLSAVSGQKHVVAKVLLTDASPAWHNEIVAWLERIRVAFETHGLGTHVGDGQSILAVADGSESLALSSYLDHLWQDGESWLDTLRSISSRVELDLLQGKHVVVYTLQPPNSAACAATGFNGLLRLEADLRAMLSEKVGVLAEQLLVRAVCPSMMTESGSLGFGQQSQTLRRLAFSVYDQLPRLVRRQPAKVLHGREAGPISAVVQFPAFSLSTAPAPGATKAERTSLSLGWPQEPAAALDEHLLLHISYRTCQTGSREQAEQAARVHRGDSNASSIADNVLGLGSFSDGDQASSTALERIVLVSAVDERGGSSTVDALGANDSGDSSIEACVERVWRFALAEASRARVRWRLAISSAFVMSQRELVAWQRMIGSYLASTCVEERVMGSVVLLSVRADESGAVVAERGARTKPSQPWAATADKSSLVLLDASDFSQIVRFAEPLPMGWTQAVGGSQTAGQDEEQGEEGEEEEEKEEEEEEEKVDGEEQDMDAMALPIATAMLVHRSRPNLLSRSAKHRLDGGASASQVLAVDMLHKWIATATIPQLPRAEDAKQEAEQDDAMDAILRSLHRLRLLSEERHQLPWPYSAQPWSVASVNTLAACLDGVVLAD